MKMKLKRMLAILLTLAMAMSMCSLGAFAEEGAGAPGAPGMSDGAAPGGDGGMMPPGGDGGMMPPGGEGGMAGVTGDSAPSDAAIVADEGKVTAKEGFESAYTVAEDGRIIVDGLKLVGEKFADNGVVANHNTVLEIKNSEITMNVTDKISSEGFGPAAAYYDEAGNKISAGLAAAVDGASTMYITDSTITVNGAGRYTIAAYNDSTMVVNNSSIVAGGNVAANGNTDAVQEPMSNAALLVSGTSRSNFSIGKSHTFYYGSECIAEGWAALSTDSATGTGLELVAYNTYAEATNGGYGTYADTNCRDYLYGVVFNAAEVGAIISNNGDIYVGSGADAKGAKTKDGYDPLSYAADGYEVNDAGSVIYAERNCFQMHSPDMMGSGTKGYSAVLTVENSKLTTVPSDELKATSTKDYSDYGAAVGAYVDYIMGSDLLIKSTGAEITLNNVEMESSNGILVHSIINSDSMSRFLKAGNEGYAVNVSMTDMDVTGDIVHDDYQRDMNVTLSATTLTGAVTMATADSWEAQWAEYAGDEAAYWTTINNDTYNTDTHATAITLENGSVWNVTADSTVTSLTVDETSKVVVAEGVTLLVNGEPYGEATEPSVGLSIAGPDTVAVGETIELKVQGMTATPMAADFAGYQAYLCACADQLWAGDPFAEQAKGEIAALTEGDTSAMIYTILVNDMGCMDFETWLASGGNSDPGSSLPVPPDNKPDNKPDEKPDEKPEDPQPPVSVEYTWTSSDAAVATVAGNGETATVTGVAAGTVTITVTASDGASASKEITVTAAADSISFSDVPAGEWYASYVETAAANGLVNGMGDGTFAPAQNLTRAQAAAIMARAMNLTGASAEKFADDNGQGAWTWASEYIYACKAAGVINGRDTGAFDPDASITRAEMATMFAKALKLTGASAEKFADDNGADTWAWASQYIYACKAAGIINGYENGTFAPDKTITRAEVAKMAVVAFVSGGQA